MPSLQPSVTFFHKYSLRAAGFTSLRCYGGSCSIVSLLRYMGYILNFRSRYKRLLLWHSCHTVRSLVVLDCLRGPCFPVWKGCWSCSRKSADWHFHAHVENTTERINIFHHSSQSLFQSLYELIL